MEWVDDITSNMHPGPLMVFGLFLLFGVLGGIIANRISWLPTISSFMALGFLIGPHGAGFITTDVLQEAEILPTIAMGLILYKLGNTLHLKHMIRSRSLLFSSLAENAVSFIAVFAVVIMAGYGQHMAWLVSAIAISSSPAVLVHVASEMRAGGPVTDRTKSLIALNNLLSFIIFSIVITFVMGKSDIGIFSAIGLTIYRFVGAVAVGTLVAWLAVRLARMLKPQDEHYRFSIVIGAITLTLGLCKMFSISALLASLVLGIATRWLETRKHRLSRVQMGEGGDLFFIILFVFAGAKIDIALAFKTGWVPLLLVLARGFGKFFGIFSSSLFTKTVKQALPVSLLLMPMASMAIGLVLAAARFVPEMAHGVTAIVLSMVAILETLGPIAAKEAFLMANESNKENPDD